MRTPDDVDILYSNSLRVEIPKDPYPPGRARQRTPRHATHPRVVTIPVSRVRNLGDRIENAGGGGHRVTGTLSGKAFACQVVVTLVKSILFLCANTK